jgi:hypothetical protein
VSAVDVLERLRRALEDKEDPEHETIREAVEVIGAKGPIVRMVESSTTLQDPSWSMLSVDELAEAARKAGVNFDDIDLALATLFLESVVDDDGLTAEERERVRRSSLRIASTFEEHRLEALDRGRGPHRMNFDSA